MAKIAKRQLVGVVTETTQGTGVTPNASTDYMWVEDADIKFEVEKLERDYSRDFLDTIPHLMGKRFGTVTFKTELKGSGATSKVPNPLSAALMACGLSAILTEAGVTSFKTSSVAPSANFAGPGKSATIHIYKDGILNAVSGALGSLKMNLEAGQIPMIEFEFKGLWNTNPYDATHPTVTVNQTNAPVVMSAQLGMHNYRPVAAKVEIDLGAQVQERVDVTAAGGLTGFQITGFQPVGSVDPEVPTVATHDFFNELISGTTGTLSAQIGSATNNTVTLSAATVQYTEVSYADRNDLLTYTVPVAFRSYGGNDSIVIKFS